MMADCSVVKRSNVYSLFLQIPISYGRVTMIVLPSGQPWTKLGRRRVMVMLVPIMAQANDVILLPRTRIWKRRRIQRHSLEKCSCMTSDEWKAIAHMLLAVFVNLILCFLALVWIWSCILIFHVMYTNYPFVRGLDEDVGPLARKCLSLI